MPPSRHDSPERIDVTITYLEQTARPTRSLPRPAEPPTFLHCTDIPVAFYRYLYGAVGEKYRWASRRYLTDDELAPLISKPEVDIYVIYRRGWPAGFAETERSGKYTLIRFFGLVSEAQGLGLGEWFLDALLSAIWQRGPERVRIETCSADSPHALQLYQRMGFAVYDQTPGYIEWYG